MSEIRANTVTDAAGTGSPSFPNGLSVASAAHRLIWKGKEYGVLGVVDPDGAGEWLEWRMSDGVAS